MANISRLTFLARPVQYISNMLHTVPQRHPPAVRSTVFI